MTPIKIQRSEGSQTVPMTALVDISAGDVLSINGQVCIAVQSAKQGSTVSFFKRATLGVLVSLLAPDLRLGEIYATFQPIGAAAPGWSRATAFSSDPIGQVIGRIEAIDDDVMYPRASLAIGDVGAAGAGAEPYSPIMSRASRFGAPELLTADQPVQVAFSAATGEFDINEFGFLVPRQTGLYFISIFVEHSRVEDVDGNNQYVLPVDVARYGAGFSFGIGYNDGQPLVSALGAVRSRISAGAWVELYEGNIYGLMTFTNESGMAVTGARAELVRFPVSEEE